MPANVCAATTVDAGASVAAPRISRELVKTTCEHANLVLFQLFIPITEHQHEAAVAPALTIAAAQAIASRH